MKFLTIAGTALLVSGAVAAPHSAARAERHRQRALNKQSKPVERITDGTATNNTNVSYSTNWAGAVLVSTGFTEVTGTFTVPSPSSKGSGSAWVGIDGDTCSTAILQTGVDWTYGGSYDAWYEWYPDYAYDFSGISISAGDSIKTTVKASSKTGGTATIENLTTGKTVTHTFSGEGSEGDLCETNAEWIVEDFESGSSLVSFADFGTVEFTSASAIKSGSTVGVTGAEILDIKQSSKVLTSCSAGTSTVTCKYV